MGYGILDLDNFNYFCLVGELKSITSSDSISENPSSKSAQSNPGSMSVGIASGK